MAYPINPGDIIEITYKSQLFLQVVMNVLHYKYTGAAAIANGAAALTNLLGDLAGANQIRDKLLACMGAEVTMVEQRAQVVYPSRKPYTSAALILAGTNVGNCTASNVAMSIQKFPDQAGRGRSGSLHLYGVPANGYASGQFTFAYIGTAQLLADLLDEKYSLNPAANDAQPVIWSRVKPTTPSNILQAVPQSTVRTMHRRTVGLGI